MKQKKCHLLTKKELAVLQHKELTKLLAKIDINKLLMRGGIKNGE
jgi:hypothetical protein